MSESHLTGGRASLAVPLEPAQVTDGDDLPNDQPVRYIYRDDPDCDTPVLGPLDGSIWRLADEEAAWDVQDGDELTLHHVVGQLAGVEQSARIRTVFDRAAHQMSSCCPREVTRLPNRSGDTLALISMLSTSPILDFPRELAHALIELPLIVEGADQHMTAFSAERGPMWVIDIKALRETSVR